MVWFLVFMLSFFGFGDANAYSQEGTSFYKGKQINLRIGSAAGSGYDLTGRLIASHYAKHIPGAPTFVVQNVPGAGSLTLANQIAQSAPKDGTMIGLVSNGMPTAPLLMPDRAKFDMSKFNWIGTNAPEAQIVMVRNTAPAKLIGDLFTTETIIGATAPGTAVYDVPFVMNALMGTKFKIISGYDGTAQIDLAAQRGEVHGLGAQGWGSARIRNLLEIQTGAIKVIAQYGFKAHHELPDVPLFKLPKNEVDRQAIILMLSRQEFGRPLVLPEGVPQDRVTLLRTAFQETMKDKEFIAEATKIGIEVNPISGEVLAALNVAIMKTSPQAVEVLRKLLSH
jgi:tripartite-type tricarboxylate transporter receptor subunit TctC